LKARQGAHAPLRRRGRDRGHTFVEILVSIVLLGTVVGATLTALRTTILSSERDEIEAQARASLLAADDAVHRTPFVVCGDPSMVDLVGSYDTAAGATTLPAGWAVDVITVSMWGRDPVSAVESWRSTCTPGADSAQLVTIIATGPTGEVGRTIQVVKRD
jgi:type II secretory pathway pseudopilin PulG